MNRINEVGEQFGSSINTLKTKIMVISRQQFTNLHLTVNGEYIEMINQVKYLGSTLNDKWHCDEKVKIRKGMANRYAFTSHPE